MTSTEAESLRTVRAGYVAQLVSLSTKKKPNYSVAGRSFSWPEYQKHLHEQIRLLDETLALGGYSEGDGPDVIITAIP